MYRNCGNSTSKCDITEVRLTYYILLYIIRLLCNVCSRFSGRMKKYKILPLLIINKPQSSLHSDTCRGSELAPWWFSPLYYYLSYFVQRKLLWFVLLSKQYEQCKSSSSTRISSTHTSWKLHQERLQNNTARSEQSSSWARVHRCNVEETRPVSLFIHC